MTKPFDDPRYTPSADLSAAEARAYEEAVLEAIREAVPQSPYIRPRDDLRPGRWVEFIVDAVELEGERPDSTIAFYYSELSDPERRLVARKRIWDNRVESVAGRQVIDSAPSFAGHVLSGFTARELGAQDLR